MNRNKKEQRRKNRRTAKQVAWRTKSVDALVGQYFNEKTAHRCPECGASPRVPMTCKDVRATKEEARVHAEWDVNTNKTPHKHLVCVECGAIGYLVEQDQGT